MTLLYQFFTYITGILNDVANLISNNWLLSVMFWLNVIYLIVIAIKLKRNTD